MQHLRRGIILGVASVINTGSEGPASSWDPWPVTNQGLSKCFLTEGCNCARERDGFLVYINFQMLWPREGLGPRAETSNKGTASHRSANTLQCVTYYRTPKGWTWFCQIYFLCFRIGPSNFSNCNLQMLLQHTYISEIYANNWYPLPQGERVFRSAQGKVL